MQEPRRRLTCARCGAAFDCGASGGDCWCAHEPYRLPLTEAGAAEGCLCPDCLRKAAAAHTQTGARHSGVLFKCQRAAHNAGPTTDHII